ncbi:MAG: histidine triad nucleotide-binding protein [Christensenellaceae bacterium]|jgi:histidine triad (HIT) family protein
MQDCLFCKIVAGEVPCQKVYEDKLTLAFHDIDKKAPEHILIVPKKHIESVLGINRDNQDYLLAMFAAAQKISDAKGMDRKGFRLVLNTGEEGGQTVFHLHMHLLGGRQMEWPPG